MRYIWFSGFLVSLSKGEGGCQTSALPSPRDTAVSNQVSSLASREIWAQTFQGKVTQVSNQVSSLASREDSEIKLLSESFGRAVSNQVSSLASREKELYEPKPDPT